MRGEGGKFFRLAGGGGKRRFPLLQRGVLGRKGWKKKKNETFSDGSKNFRIRGRNGKRAHIVS